MVNVTFTDEGNMGTWIEGEEGPELFIYNNADMGWILVSAVLVMIMAPGVGLLYSGLLRRKNALSMLLFSFLVFSLAIVHWFLFGYSLAFSGSSNAFIGNFRNGGFVDTDIAPSGKIPVLLFAFYQSMFAGVTQVIVVGGAAERARIFPVLVFMFAWATIVYAPVANWVWNANGWIYQLGDLDFAGGGPVHITSGTAGLALSFFLGRRRGYGTAKLAYRPHSVSHIVIGTTLLWFGWFGFNGGSALAMNLRSIQACVATNVAASTAALTWTALDYIYTRKISAVSMASGVLAGLVGITPAAGYVGTPAAMAIGFLTAIACNYATGIKVLLKIDDAVDSYALHGIGGFVGSFLTGLFADSRVTSFDGTEIDGGWINHNYIQLGYQLAASVTIMAYTFVVSLILLYAINFIPGLKLRASEESEIVGIDEAECGEAAYDFVSIRREVEDDSGATPTVVPSVHSTNSHEKEKAPRQE
ncbi:hypothetical protein JCM8547_005809 [Rhodosporidiobolus lusitaniae]